ncbi:MAG: multidrug ABC transporter ATP-binding protein [Thermoprotei archaeon]|nr:MAG: multidrug ABC transporter ATP-binding protein [Thermoprotei archaeon]RLE99331.1 MAG: multidrug ABC transporter ATP-binding protein [Thermoprotei archaeon]
MEAVEVIDLKKFFGNFPALKGISFEVEEGEIFGLIGPNGAGKTTTFRIIAGLIPPTSGEVKILGKSLHENLSELRRVMSYLPEDAGAYKNITGYEFLQMVSEIYFGKTREAEEALELGVRLADLGDRVYSKMKTYSKGMKRRIQVARVFMVKPKIAILDEPTSGLDVIHATKVRNMIKDFAQKYGTTVLVSSHNMLEVEYVCQKVALINKGEILAKGVVKELLEEHGAKNLEELFLKLVRGEKHD